MANDPIITNVINRLISEKLIAKFIPLEKGTLPQGYYIMQSPYFGPVMAYFGQAHKKTTEIIIKIQQTRIEIRTTPNCNKNEFQHYVDFIRSLRPIPTTITSNEAIEQFDYFISPTAERKKHEQHYLNARIMYDTMYDMMRALPRDTKFTDIKGGYEISAKIDGAIETIRIKNMPAKDTILISMPNIGLHDRFVCNGHTSDIMVYIKAQEFLDVVTGKKTTPTMDLIEFTRRDAAYQNAMQNIIKARQVSTNR